jgi:hypothetical protein
MAKGQRRSNREAKKPKQAKSQPSATTPLALTSGSTALESAALRGRQNPTSGRTGRR